MSKDARQEVGINSDELFEAMSCTALKRLKSLGWKSDEAAAIGPKMIDAIMKSMECLCKEIARELSAAFSCNEPNVKMANLLASATVAVRAVEIADEFHARRGANSRFGFSVN